MTFEIASFSFTLYELGLMAAMAALVGMAKTGLQGAGLIAIPVLAIVFGGKASTGILLPVLIIADLFGVYYYHQHAALDYLKKMIPFALLGVVLGTMTGDAIDETLFSHTMVAIIFLSLCIMVWRERSSDIQVPNSFWFVAIIGIVGGFTSMVGNLAGPVMALYLLAMQLPKNQLIGTAAWFFLVINLVKVPFHVFVWETITWDTFLLDIVLIPAVAVGAVLGVYVVKRIPETGFRWFVIIATGASAVAMMV